MRKLVERIQMQPNLRNRKLENGVAWNRC